MGDLLNNGFNTTDGRMYLITERTLERLDIQFTPPDIQVDSRPTIATIQIVGRNTPRYQYIGGEPTIRLTLDFYANEVEGQDVVAKCRFLESLTASDGSEGPFQRVKMIFGDLYKNDMWVVKSAPYRLFNFDESVGYLPKHATVELTLAKDPTDNLRWRDIRYS